jgi:hypothetical protein
MQPRPILNMEQPFTIDFAEYVPFERVSDEHLAKYRLMNKCRLSDTGCWLWIGTTDGRGYGMVSFRSKDRRAHRVSYELFKGPIPAGLHILHRCDNSACVNPAHLRAGTAKENMADREARGRRDVRGEQIGTSKLTEQQVLEIRSSMLRRQELADKYGIHPHHVWLIRTGRAWKHLDARQENVDGR